VVSVERTMLLEATVEVLDTVDPADPASLLGSELLLDAVVDVLDTVDPASLLRPGVLATVYPTELLDSELLLKTEPEVLTNVMKSDGGELVTKEDIELLGVVPDAPSAELEVIVFCVGVLEG